MISSATVQSAIVLMNRRMKVERGPATAGFVPVCSSVEDMYLHHLGGTRAAQEGSARFEEAADPPTARFHREGLHRHHGWEGDWGRGSPRSAFVSTGANG